jgi:hypothetical protein
MTSSSFRLSVKAMPFLLAMTFAFTLGGSGQAQDRGAPSWHCFDDSAQCMISAATKYIDALVTHEPSDVPLAPDCQRRENATDTGDTAEAIRQSMTPPTPDQIITDARDIRWFVDQPGHEAIAYYLLDVATTPPQTVHLAERFKVEHGLIEQIEAIFSTNTISDSGFPPCTGVRPGDCTPLFPPPTP